MNMHNLLQEAGYRVQGRRADCKNCRGGSRLTVSFTSEVAYCHRCHWTANAVMLARGLGKTVKPESAQKRAARAKVARFAQWVDAQHTRIAARYRCLGCSAAKAHDILIHFPECEAAWDALALFYENEGRLVRMLDALCFERVSQWLETPETPVSLFRAWEASHA